MGDKSCENCGSTLKWLAITGPRKRCNAMECPLHPGIHGDRTESQWVPITAEHPDKWILTEAPPDPNLSKRCETCDRKDFPQGAWPCNECTRSLANLAVKDHWFPQKAPVPHDGCLCQTADSPDTRPWLPINREPDPNMLRGVVVACSPVLDAEIGRRLAACADAWESAISDRDAARCELAAIRERDVAKTVSTGPPSGPTPAELRRLFHAYQYIQEAADAWEDESKRLQIAMQRIVHLAAANERDAARNGVAMAEARRERDEAQQVLADLRAITERDSCLTLEPTIQGYPVKLYVGSDAVRRFGSPGQPWTPADIHAARIAVCGEEAEAPPAQAVDDEPDAEPEWRKSLEFDLVIARSQTQREKYHDAALHWVAAIREVADQVAKLGGGGDGE